MRSIQPVIPLLLAGASRVLGEATLEDTSTYTVPVPQCTASSQSHSGAFFDLRPDTAVAVDAAGSSYKRPTKDYHARGWDYGKNFTLNICGAVVEPVTDVVGVEQDSWANVSAYYTQGDSVYSIGEASLDLTSRGRKLVLRYSNGSPCDSLSSQKRDDTNDRSHPWTVDDEDHPVRPAFDTEDTVYPDSTDHPDLDDENDAPYIDDGSKKTKGDAQPVGQAASTRRKSTTISFICDRDPASSSAALSFVGTDPDECAYFFEARSIHACAHAEPHKPGSVGPGSIFGLILIIAVLVYVLGGVFYNRTISHSRGWRQLPNYSLWAGIWSFTTDIFVIATASCARLLPRRRGYTPVGAHSRHRDAEAENRLIDQLDEEWED